MSGNHQAHHNQTHLCGPANAQNQIEILEQLRSIDSSLQAFSASLLESTLKAKVEFAYTDVYQRALYPVRANTMITRIVLIMIEPFNDLDATISVGDDQDPERLVQVAAIDLSTPCSFTYQPNYVYAADTAIQLYMNPAYATGGRGIVYIYAD